MSATPEISYPALSRGGYRSVGFSLGGAPIYGGRPILSREVMAFSASSSPISVSGRRWLLQHRDRRLLVPGSGGSLSTASAGCRGGKLVLNGFGSDPMTASRLAVVSRIPEPKEEEREARASRG
ncbi:hypothetical protein DY000_02038307 [Brassica cretica]|uniref:Uncharacterized protein n=1 Tax=Brassica cretica TaxID=69181 RepID=A0ABQ7BKF9_BRACR|nr:hypothetical protein DY000_02038307 [Brassica cretica]